MSSNEPNGTATPPVESDEAYPCIGVCMADPESGLCEGCGRPLAEPQSPKAEGAA